MDEGQLYHFQDVRCQPDPIHPYTADLQQSVIIDNGSYQSRVGWASDEEPRLAFRNCYAKHRKDRGKKLPVTTELLVGNDLTNLEAVRFQLKTAHDESVVTHFQAQELLLDYTFSHLGLTSSNGVEHPCILTEPLLNPGYSRALMSELLFECYSVPKVAYCVDSLASYYHNTEDAGGLQDGLLVNLGHHHCHVIPILDGRPDLKNVRRIKVGGCTMTKFLWRWLQLKYSQHTNNITLSRAEELIHARMRISSDFQHELSAWADTEYYSAHVFKVQLPYTEAVVVPVDPILQKERRREAARRLVLINARKREEKLLEDETELSRLSELSEAMSEFRPYQAEYQHALEEAGVSSEEELHKALQHLQHRIQKTKAKLVQQQEQEDSNESSPAAPVPEIVVPSGGPEWVASLQEEWRAIQQRRAARRSRRNEMAKRRTVASQERMRIISQLARREKKEDNFGRRDEDWDVYKAINKEGGGSDSEEESDRIQELEVMLKQHSPAFLAVEAEPLSLAERHQLHLSTEMLRTGEVLFQPSLVGVEQGGLSDTVEYVLSRYPPHLQQRLVGNVFVTGGPANMPGIVERIQDELRAIRPFQSQFKVTKAKSPSVDAWHGCRSASSSLLDTAGLTKQDYMEHGGERTPPHMLGNPFWVSRNPEPIEDPKNGAVPP